MKSPKGREGLLILPIPRLHPGAAESESRGEGPGNLHPEQALQLSLGLAKVWASLKASQSTLLTPVPEVPTRTPTSKG